MTPPSEPPTPRTVLTALRDAAADPDGHGITWVERDGEEGQRTSYAELDLRARVVGADLHRLLPAGSRVLLLYPPSAEYLIGFFGCLYAGLVAVPAYPPHAGDSHSERLRSIYHDCAPGAVLTIASLRAQTAKWFADHDLTAPELIATDLLEAVPLVRPTAIAANHPAFLQYTSGSTAAPKGVVVTHDNLAANEAVIAAGLGHDRDTVIVSWLPLFHDMGLIGNALQAVWLGGSAAFMAPETFIRRPGAWLRAIDRYGASTSGGPNFAYDLCSSRVSTKERAALDLSRWKVAFNGAEPVQPGTLRRFAETFAAAGFRAEAMFPCYGLAEATLYVAGSRPGKGACIRRFDLAALEAIRTAVADEGGAPFVGYEVIAAGHDVSIRTDEGNVLPELAVGEICISGPSVTTGYWNNPAATARTFSGSSTGNNVLRTGDLGFLAEGRLFVTARIKDLIIVRGRNIAPQDLEGTASTAVPGVRRVAAFSVPENEQELVVLVVELRERPGWFLGGQLAERIRTAVASHHQIPVYAVILVSGGTIDTTSSGKVQRGRVRGRFLNGDLPIVAQVTATAPDTETQDNAGAPDDSSALETVRRHLSRILRRRLADDELAAVPARLGLDSLQMVALVAALEQSGYTGLTGTDLLGDATISELAARLTLAGHPERAGPATSGVILATAAQRRMWLLDQLGDTPATATVPVRLTVSGQLDEERLREALTRVQARHAVLRLSLHEERDSIFMRLSDPVRLPLVCHDLRALDPAVRLRIRDDLEMAALSEAIALQSAPLWRAMLIRHCDDDAELFVTFHHSIADGWSVRVFLDDLAAALSNGLEVAESAGYGYLDYAAAMPRSGPAAIEFWKSELAGVSQTLALPADRPRPPVQTFGARCSHRSLGPGRIRLWRQRAAEQSVTAFTVALTAYAALLHRWTGQPQMLIGTPFANREDPRLATVMGPMLNTLPLRVDAPDATTFAELGNQLATRIRRAVMHGSVPFETICDHLVDVRDPSRPPLCQFFFNHLAFGPVLRTATGLRISATPVLDRAAKFDLELYIVESGDDVELQAVANADLFDTDRIEELVDQYLLLLDAYLTAPSADWRAVPLRTARLTALVGDPSAPVTVWRGPTTDDLLNRIAEHARESARSAIRATGATWSYRRYAEEISSLSARLSQAGVAHGATVAIDGIRDARLATAILAVLHAGAAFCVVDRDLPAGRRAELLAQASPAAWISLEDPDEPIRAVTDARGIPRLGYRAGELLAGGRGTCSTGAPEAGPPRRAGCVVFTSGSTGMAKAVLGARDALAAFLNEDHRRYELRSDDRFAMLSALGHDPLQRDVLTAAWSGAELLVPDPATYRDPVRLWRWLLAERPTFTNLTPSMVKFLASGATGAGAEMAAPSLRLLTLVGESLDEATAALAARLFPAARLISLYGATETQRVLMSYELNPGRLRTGETIPVGRAPTGAQVMLVTDNGRLAGVGEPGEVWVRSPFLALGYVGDAELTAAKFISNPFRDDPDDRIYRTGDIGRFDPDGTLRLYGRIDRQVQINGYRVEPAEVEAVLRAHPGIRECAVVPYGLTAGSAAGLAAYVAATASVTDEQLHQALRTQLPAHLAPSRWNRLPRLPRTGTGKVDLTQLQAAASLAASQETGVTCPPLGAGTQGDSRVAEMWAQVLRLERPTPEQDFFRVGGDSLRAAELIARLRHDLGVELSIRELFGAPCLADLMAAVRRLTTSGTAGPATSDPALRSDPAERYFPFPLNDIQEAYWVGRRADFTGGGVASHSYTEFDGAGLEPQRLAAALQRLVERHDMLRCVITPDGNQRVLDPPPRVVVPVHDLRTATGAAIAAHLDQVRSRMSHQVRDGHHWPLLEMEVTRLPADHHRVHLSVDFLIADASSWGVIAPELDALYRDADAPLPEPAFTFRDYMRFELAARQTPAYSDAEKYWLNRVATLPPGPELPLAVEPGSLTRPRFERLGAKLTSARWQSLRDLAARERTTPSALLAAAFAEILGGWSTQPRFTLDLTIFNRPPGLAGVDSIVGDFTSITLLEVDTQRPADLRGLLQQVHQQICEALEHRQFSGVRVLRAAAQARGGVPLPVPVIFTSKLGLSDLAAVAGSLSWLGERGYAVSQTPQVWLDHQVSATAAGELVFNWDYVTDLFPAGMVADMFAAYQRLLVALADDPRTMAGRFRDLLPEQQRLRRDAANATAAPMPGGCLDERIWAAAARQPGAIAVRAPDRVLTYAELDCEAGAIAGWILAHGGTRDELVAVMMDKGWQQIVAVAGILRAGCAYLPIDAMLPARRVHDLLRIGQVRLIVTQPGMAARQPVLDDYAVLTPRPGDKPVPEAGTATTSPNRSTPTDLAYVIFTSGSTGIPQGVMIEHAAAVNTIVDVNTRSQVGPADRIFGISGLGFDLSVYDIFGPLYAGGSVVLPGADDLRDPARWHQILHGEQVTIWNSAPALMVMLVEWLEIQAARLPDSLRLVMLSGDWIPVDLAERVRALGRDVQVISMGGATEAAIWSIWYPIGKADPDWPSVPYGWPMANQQFHVLDWLGRVRPEWAIGRLCIAGAGLARGYWDNAVLTSQRFVSDPGTGDRLYVTGDLGRVRPSGVIEFLGREDFQVKIQGYRVEPSEIETVLAQHPLVSRVVVLARGDEKDGRYLVGYIVPASHGEKLAHATLADDHVTADLRDHLARSLPAYMVPTVFVMIPSLPVTANGKTDRKALPDPRGLSPDPRPTDDPGKLSHHLQAVTDAFTEVLGRIGITPADNFFTLGGTSLLAVRLHQALTRRTGVDLPIATVFRYGTVAELAVSLDRTVAATVDTQAPNAGAKTMKLARQRGEAIRRIRGGRYRH